MAYVIDIHQHPYPGVHEFMQQQHINVSVLLPGAGGNDRVLAWARKWPGMFVPFWWADLADPARAADQLEAAVARGHRGIKFQPLTQRFRMNERRMWPLYERAAKLKVPVLFHTGVVAFKEHWAEFASPLPIDEVAETFGDLKIIIAHMGGQYHNEAVVIAEKNANVHLDTAYLHFFCRRMLPKLTPLDLIKRAVEFAGPRKVLYGFEGTPTSLIIDSDLDPDHKKRILWQNARELLNLPEPTWAGEGV
jgi:predicted TIM-barrel fold metal-dependent hydrolase